VLLLLLVKALLLHGMVLFLLIEMAGNNMVLLLLPIWLAKVTKKDFIFAKDDVIAVAQDGWQ